MDPNIVDAGVAWLAGEIARHTLLYLPWLLVLGVGAVLGILIFGRGYKKRIPELERKIALLERELDKTSDRVVIHGDLNIIENQYNSADGQYHAEIEGRAKIVSPVPVRLTADPLPLKGTGQSDLKPITPKDTITEHGILSLYDSGYPKSLTTWDALKEGKQANHPAGPPPRSGTTPMQGIAELERCHAELVKYIAKPYNYPIGQQEIVATQEFLPYVVKLCRILDEQEIPYPPIPRELTFTGTGEWGDFLAELMAVQHDIERARRVYQGDSRD